MGDPTSAQKGRHAPDGAQARSIAQALDDGQTPKKVTEQDVFYERLAEAAQRFAGTLHSLCGPGIALFEPDLEVAIIQALGVQPSDRLEGAAASSPRRSCSGPSTKASPTAAFGNDEHEQLADDDDDEEEYEDEDDVPCDMCGEREGPADNPIVLCDFPGCSKGLHLSCMSPPHTTVPHGMQVVLSVVRKQSTSH